MFAASCLGQLQYGMNFVIQIKCHTVVVPIGKIILPMQAFFFFFAVLLHFPVWTWDNLSSKYRNPSFLNWDFIFLSESQDLAVNGDHMEDSGVADDSMVKGDRRAELTRAKKWPTPAWAGPDRTWPAWAGPGQPRPVKI